MKSFLVASASLVASGVQGLPTFESFVELHARSYQHGSTEYEQRKALYQQRLVDAEAQNNSPNKKWTAGVNKLWDWTESELQSLRGWDGAMMPEGHQYSRSIAKHGSFLQQAIELPKEKLWDSLETFAYTKKPGILWVLLGHCLFHSDRGSQRDLQWKPQSFLHTADCRLHAKSEALRRRWWLQGRDG